MKLFDEDRAFQRTIALSALLVAFITVLRYLVNDLIPVITFGDDFFGKFVKGLFAVLVLALLLAIILITIWLLGLTFNKLPPK